VSHIFAPPAEAIDRLRSRTWLAAAIGIAASVGGYFLDSGQFFRSYLVSWLFWLGIALGCYAVALLHQLSRGAWGLMIRRALGAATRTLPLMLLLFVPIVLGLSEIYVWARPDALADPVIQQKSWYLNRNGFILRAVVYFLIWMGPAWLLNRMSLRQDEATEDRTFRRMQGIAAPALGLYCLAATFASVDWLMSLDPHWYSSLWGVNFIGGHAVSAFAFIIPVALFLARRKPMDEQFQPRHFHDYGKLLLAFVMLWTYFQLSQLIIIWSGNLPEEVSFYLARTEGGWKWLSILLAVGHFALPFFLLLSRDLKRDARRLAWVALILLAMRWVDLYWQAAPAFAHAQGQHGLHFHWLDLATLVGIGGLWLAVYFGQLKKRPLLPAFEPYLREAVADE
jgi:hypothetical protein